MNLHVIVVAFKMPACIKKYHDKIGTMISGAAFVVILAGGSAVFSCFLEVSKMDKVAVFAKNFLQEEDGVTAIEYGLIAALIAVVIIASVTAVGQNLVRVFQNIASALASAL